MIKEVIEVLEITGKFFYRLRKYTQRYKIQIFNRTEGDRPLCTRYCFSTGDRPLCTRYRFSTGGQTPMHNNISFFYRGQTPMQISLFFFNTFVDEYKKNYLSSLL